MRQGGWVESARAWNDTNVSYCDVCGRLIPKRSWVFADDGRTLNACSPDCEDLYHSYLKRASKRKQP